MSNTSMLAAAGDARRAHVEALLVGYPDVTPDERQLLVNWFRSEASALDVATVASNPAVQQGYRRFREDHVDRFTIRDMGYALAFAAAVVLAVLLIAWRAA